MLPSAQSLHHQVAPDAAQPVEGHDGDRITRRRPTYTCIRCRARRVKCNRAQPACSNCVKANVQCIPPNQPTSMLRPSCFPQQARRTRRQEDSRARLQRLEEMVERLSAEVERHSSGTQGDAGEDDRGQDQVLASPIAGELRGMVVPGPRSRYFSPFSWVSVSEEIEDIRHLLEHQHIDAQDSLPMHPGNTIPSAFPALTPSDISSMPAPSEPLSTTLVQLYLTHVDPLIRIIHVPSFLDQLHQHRQAHHYHFTRHVSTMSPTVSMGVSPFSSNGLQFSTGTSSPTTTDSDQDHRRTRAFDALLFAAYYAAASSTVNDGAALASLIEAGLDVNDLATRFKRCAEIALDDADFVQNETLESLQAVVLLLSVTARGSDPRTPWIQLGLAIRIAQAMGIHRDGSHYGLKPVETEVRRRLWAQICLLDLRTAEELGCEPTILEGTYDTRLPTSISDYELSQLELEGSIARHPNQDMPQQLPADSMQGYTTTGSYLNSLQWGEASTIPAATRGRRVSNTVNSSPSTFSDMTFSLIRYEAARLFGKLLSPKYQLDDSTFDSASNSARINGNGASQDKNVWVNQLERKFTQVYNVQMLDDSDPMQRMTAELSKLLISKARLLVSLQEWKDSCREMPRSDREGKRDRLFNDATAIIDQTITLAEESTHSNWLWYVNTFTEVYASTFVVFNLAQGGVSPECADRAWRAIDRLFPTTEMQMDGGQLSPFQRLLALARARHRDRTLSRVNNVGAANEGLAEGFVGDPVEGQPLWTSDLLRELDLTLADPFWLNPYAGETIPNNAFFYS
ncbi:uncharacterized protein BDZ99DRAFT_518599 [Mytilinidion resinicola]|uniref:Zn(2)-C6 fungal-type domain-containing protein n=1 Tax=Mytilinidion resinicola TaxID=574789 RepID=A0A6A6YSG7_9PEZI|nr:uncharacterized protein BDZ99DRAFT_518599 [Mytilinidion resinicola]KAF2811313.1 hypothetical protein BDZ99DRAFT_518599 [Mytilinidion resinicola]